MTNRKEAQKVADAWEEAARLRTSENQFRRVMQSNWERTKRFRVSHPAISSSFGTRLLERVSPTTANKYIKILRLAFQDALREHLLSDNPAKLELVGSAKRKDGKNGNAERPPFKLTELRRLLDVASSEWRGLILFGLYTGQRLGDIARLVWLSVSLQGLPLLGGVFFAFSVLDLPSLN